MYGGILSDAHVVTIAATRRRQLARGSLEQEGSPVDADVDGGPIRRRQAVDYNQSIPDSPDLPPPSPPMAPPTIAPDGIAGHDPRVLAHFTALGGLPAFPGAYQVHLGSRDPRTWFHAGDSRVRAPPGAPVLNTTLLGVAAAAGAA